MRKGSSEESRKIGRQEGEEPLFFFLPSFLLSSEEILPRWGRGASTLDPQ
jgi:hypothetical protein